MKVIAFLKRLCAASALLVTAACQTVDEPALSHEVASLVKPGESIDIAITHLQEAKFSCTPNGTTDVDCTRQRYAKIVLSCLERVALKDSVEGKTVVQVNISPIRCLGGFG
jgi:hypothetical protein